MNLQQIYNATYNYFAERSLWPQSISYDPEWEFSEIDKVRNAFNLGKRDGTINKLNNELVNSQECVDSEVALKK